MATANSIFSLARFRWLRATANGLIRFKRLRIYKGYTAYIAIGAKKLLNPLYYLPSPPYLGVRTFNSIWGWLRRLDAQIRLLAEGFLWYPNAQIGLLAAGFLRHPGIYITLWDSLGVHIIKYSLSRGTFAASGCRFWPKGFYNIRVDFYPKDIKRHDIRYQRRYAL